MANALALRTELNLDELQRTATMLVASGYFDAKGERNMQIAQLATKIMAGRELGYGPFASVQGIHVIQGKPQISANLMAAAVKAHPRYDYKVRKMEADAVAIEFFENGESIGTSTFTADDAKRANTQNMSKFPRNMLFARALSNGVRWFCPDVFHGQSVYVEGEIEDTGDDTPAVVVVDRATGEVVEGEYSAVVTPVTPVTNGNGKRRNPAENMPEVMHQSETPIYNKDVGVFVPPPVEAPADEVQADDVPMISELQMKRLHAVGTNLYGKKWNAKRPALVAGATKKRAEAAGVEPWTSANDLTDTEADTLIRGIQKRINEAAAEVQTAPDTTADNPFEGEPEPA